MDEALQTPEALAAKLGQMRPVNLSLEDSPYSPEHMAAAVMHGWNAFRFFKGADVLLSDADYLAALAAVAEGKPHAGADFTEKAQPPDAEFARRHFAAMKKGGQQ